MSTQHPTSEEELLIILIRLVQGTVSGGTEQRIMPDTVPYEDIEGFDSFTALEVLTEMEHLTGIKGKETFFVAKGKLPRPMAVKEIAKKLWANASREEETHARHA